MTAHLISKTGHLVAVVPLDDKPRTIRRDGCLYVLDDPGFAYRDCGFFPEFFFDYFEG